MIKTIFLMCLAAGTALLGRSGDMFPKPGRDIIFMKMAVDIWERVLGGSIPPSPRHLSKGKIIGIAEPVFAQDAKQPAPVKM